MRRAPRPVPARRRFAFSQITPCLWGSLGAFVVAWSAATGPTGAGRINSDSLIPALVSIDNYMPFYWAQNNYGMLLPWLAQPIRDYGWNLLAQMIAVILLALLAIVLLERWIFGGPSRARTAWLLTIPLAFVVYRHNLKVSLILFQCSQPYSASLALGLAAVLTLCRSPRWLRLARFPLAGGLLFLSIWVNPSAVPVWAALLAGEVWRNRGSRAAWVDAFGGMALLLIDYALLGRWATHYPPRDDRRLIPWANYWTNFQRLWDDADRTYVTLWLIPIVLGIGLVLYWRGTRSSEARRQALTGLVPIVAIAVTYLFLVASSEWVWINYSDSRYLTTTFFMLIFSSLLLVARPLGTWLVERLPLSIAEAIPPVLAIACVTYAFGLATPEVALDRLARQEEQTLRDTQSAGCDVIAGEYFRTWMIIFRGKVKHAPQEVIALTPRSEYQTRTWNSFDPQTSRWCAVCGDPQFAFELKRRQIPVPPQAGRVGSICWYHAPASPAQ